MNGEQLLQQTLQIFEERRVSYGPPAPHLHEVARRWAQVLECEVSPLQVAMCLIELKLARLKANPFHADSIADIAGYAAVMAELLPADNRNGARDGNA